MYEGLYPPRRSDRLGHMSESESETTIHDQVKSENQVVADCAGEVEELRDSIDDIDAAVVHILAERFRVTGRIGRLKARAGFGAADSRRETQQVARLRGLAKESGLDPDLAEAYLHLVADAAKRLHLRAGAEEH